MKRMGLVLLCLVAVSFVGWGKQDIGWSSPYTPTRLEWLALQCNIHHQKRYDMVHTSFVAVPPNKVEVVVKYSQEAKKIDASIRKDIAEGGKEYVRGVEKAMGWTQPVEVEAIEVYR